MVVVVVFVVAGASLEARLLATLSAAWMSFWGMVSPICEHSLCSGPKKVLSASRSSLLQCQNMQTRTVSNKFPFAALHMHLGSFVPHPESPTQLSTHESVNENPADVEPAIWAKVDRISVVTSTAGVLANMAAV